jgi:hypothetical protein
MILSVRHKFIFIKGYKVAGTSIEIALSQLCGPDDIVTPILPVDERMRIALGGRCQNFGADRLLEQGYLALVAGASPNDLSRIEAPSGNYYNHMPLVEVTRRYPDALSGFRLVCAERSPYAKMLSWLNMSLAIDSYRRGGKMRGDPESMQAAFDRLASRGRLDVVRNIDLYRGADGRIDALVMRYEMLQSEFDSFVLALGVVPTPELPHAKRGMMSNGIDPRTVLRRDQLDAINKAYADEFDFFRYPRL